MNMIPSLTLDRRKLIQQLYNTAKADNGILNKIRIAEWIIVICGLLIHVWGISGGSGSASEQNFVADISTSGGILVLTSVLFLLNKSRSPGFTTVLLLSQILISEIVSVFTCAHFLGLLIFSAAAKAFILLNSRSRISIVCVFAVMAMTAGICLNLHDLLRQTASTERLLVELNIWLSAFFGLAFLGMFCFLILSENQSRSKTRQLMEQIEELTLVVERQRIGRELHDSLGHRLVSLTLQLDIASKYLSKNEQGKAEESIALARSITDKALLEIRDAVSNLREPVFDFEKDVQELVNEVRLGLPIQIDLTLNPLALKELSQESSRHLLAITKECLNNVRKHSGARHVDIILEKIETDAVLTVSDDGVGFVQGSQTGFGMTSLKERARHLDAKLDLLTKPNQGTKISVRFPL